MNHKQHGNSSWFIPNRADCVPALLTRYSIDTIWCDQASLVLEDQSGQLESDSAVVSRVPLQRHLTKKDETRFREP